MSDTQSRDYPVWLAEADDEEYKLMEYARDLLNRPNVVRVAMHFGRQVRLYEEVSAGTLKRRLPDLDANVHIVLRRLQEYGLIERAAHGVYRPNLVVASKRALLWLVNAIVRSQNLQEIRLNDLVRHPLAFPVSGGIHLNTSDFRDSEDFDVYWGPEGEAIIGVKIGHPMD